MIENKAKSPIPSFISKLQAMLEDPSNLNIITWTQQGDSFVVVNPTVLEQSVLPSYFKHQHFASFSRQLNMYNFQKIRNQNNQPVFWHSNFQRGKVQLLPLLKRNSHHLTNLTQQQYCKRFFKDKLAAIKLSMQNDEQQLNRIMNQHGQILQQHQFLYQNLQMQRQEVELKLDRLTAQVQTLILTKKMDGNRSIDNDSMSRFFDVDSCENDKQSECLISENL